MSYGLGTELNFRLNLQLSLRLALSWSCLGLRAMLDALLPGGALQGARAGDIDLAGERNALAVGVEAEDWARAKLPKVAVHEVLLALG